MTARKLLPEFRHLGITTHVISAVRPGWGLLQSLRALALAMLHEEG